MAGEGRKMRYGMRNAKVPDQRAVINTGLSPGARLSLQLAQ